MGKPKSTREKATVKWRSLKHKGPQFSPPYKRLGRNLQLFRYGGQTVKLSLKAEEAAVHYARYLMRENAPTPTFKKNFFNDWRDKYMNASERKKINSFSRCNFTMIKRHLAKLAQDKKQLSKQQKDKLKRDREQLKQKYGTVQIDGRKELINNFMVEPPGLYIGRGNNRNSGKIKDRIVPQDVTINCSEGFRVAPPPGTHWKGYEHNHSRVYIAKYKDPITGQMKHIYPHASSKIISESAKVKYNKAVELSRKITNVLQKNYSRLKSKDNETCQLATAVYLLNLLAIRVGTEREAGENETVGCTTLRKEHIRFLDRNNVRFSFEGKDYVPYENTVKVSPLVYENLIHFVRQKTQDSFIFDLISSKKVNDYLETLMDGLTAKVFRTYKATECYKNSFKKYMQGVGRNDDLKKKAFVHAKANLEVAKLLNHQVMAPKTLENRKRRCETLDDRLEDMKRVKRGLDPSDVEKKKGLEAQIHNKAEELTIKKDAIKWAPGTSLINYIDPREVKRLCSSLKLPLDKVYSKAQLNKFKWAVGN